jgi:hypothetical protein
MQPTKSSERKKRILTFAGLYAASVILMFFIFSAFGVHFSVNDQKGNTAIDDRQTTADNDILQKDSLLHAKLQLLQQSDDEYSLLLADSSSQIQRSNAMLATSLYETAFNKAIDSIDQATNYTGDKAIMYKTMINSFKSIASNRQALKNIPLLNAGKPIPAADQQDILVMKNLLNQKDNELTRAREELKALQGKGFIPSKQAGAVEAQAGEIDVLKTAFNDQQKDYQAMQEKYNRLKTENGNLASQVIEYKKAASAQTENANTESENKINMLEQKLQGLNADLYFAKIDCNLARVDAQQMISNARQRKELLSESLVMLTSLSSSGDAGIQKKAKEKIIHLNHIATSLHD